MLVGRTLSFDLEKWINFTMQCGKTLLLQIDDRAHPTRQLGAASMIPIAANGNLAWQELTDPTLDMSATPTTLETPATLQTTLQVQTILQTPATLEKPAALVTRKVAGISIVLLLCLYSGAGVSSVAGI